MTQANTRPDVTILRIDERESKGRVEIRIYMPCMDSSGRDRKVGVVNVPHNEAPMWIEWLRLPHTRIVHIVEIEEPRKDKR